MKSQPKGGLRTVVAATVVSRILVAAVAVLSVHGLGIDHSHAETADRPDLSQPFGQPLDDVTSPLVRWDALWYLSIAHEGYWFGDPAEGTTPVRPEDSQRVAFFPLYPLAVRALSGNAASPALLLAAGFAISLAAFAAALALLHRLVAAELGEDRAKLAVWLVALFPGSFAFSSPYSESLFLLLAVGAVHAASRGREVVAWVAAVAAGATRSAGLALAPALVLLGSLRAPRLRAGRGLALGLAPVVGLAAYAAYLWLETGDPRAFAHQEEYWTHEFAGPFGGLITGAVAATEGLVRLARGGAGPAQQSIDGDAVMLFGFAVFAVVATIGCLRRLPLRHGAYAVASLALATTFPVELQPLQSLPRYLAVIFPLFMWLALVCDTPARRRLALALSAIGLVVLTGRFATWEMTG